MAIQGKNYTLSLPVKLILTEKGASHFISQNKKLIKFRLIDSKEGYGLPMQSFAPDIVQRMILLDYISYFELETVEVSTLRSDIMDMSKMIVFSLLYKQFDKQVLHCILSSEMIKKHNRANPGRILDAKISISDSEIRATLASQGKIQKEASKFIIHPVIDGIVMNQDIHPEEKNVLILMAEKFISNLSPICWYILLQFWDRDGILDITKEIRVLLEKFIDRTKLAEYISLMLIELAVAAENAKLRREAKSLYHGVMDESAVIYDAEVRKKVTGELIRKNETMFLLWKLGGGSTSIGTQGRVQLTLYSKRDLLDELKTHADSKRAIDVNNHDLTEFFKSGTENIDDNSLGMFYLSYLIEECNKASVKFESIVTKFQGSDLLVIDLVFVF